MVSPLIAKSLLIGKREVKELKELRTRWTSVEYLEKREDSIFFASDEDSVPAEK